MTKDKWDKAGIIAAIIFGGLTAIGTIWLAFFRVPDIVVSIQQLGSEVKNATNAIENITKTTYVSCSHPINASCVCDYRDENGYLNFKKQKCDALSIGESVNLTTQGITQVSQYFIIASNGQLARFSITKNLDNTCTESGTCNYYVSVVDSSKVYG